MMMTFLPIAAVTFCLSIIAAKSLTGPCDELLCKAGQECQIDENGEAFCVCVKECPTHPHSVCGSDNRSYVNHCYLHREACLTQKHIKIQHSGNCKNEKVEPMSTTSLKPVACFKQERDSLREKMISSFRDQLKLPDISRWTSSYDDLIWAEFYTCDLNKDNSLDANEFLECVKANSTFDEINEKEHPDLTRALCIDAIMDISDENHDWKLNYTEFLNCLNPEFQADTKQCMLEDREYKDGEEINVGCNNCVCACGNWVCTSALCHLNYTLEEERTENSEDISDQQNTLQSDEDESTIR